MVLFVPAKFLAKRFDPLPSGHTVDMSLPNETTESKPSRFNKSSLPVRKLIEDQEYPVPTTEASNGEVVMDPEADAPAQAATDHLDALDTSASRSPASSSSEGEYIDIDEAEARA